MTASQSHLTKIVPAAEKLRLPLTRDQLMLLMAAINQFFLGVDIYLAHSISGDIKSNEWIPIIFGISAAIILLLAGLLAFRNRPLATILANLVFLGSIIVGVVGIIFHLSRTSLLSAPVSEPGTAVYVLTWAPPLLGPAFFILVGVLGISAAWIEEPVNSGRLRLLGNRHVQMPYSKTRAYYFIVGVFILGTLISSVLDHARIELENPYVWIPIGAGLFGVIAAFMMGIIEEPSTEDVAAYAAAMVLLILVGLIGFVLHLNTNLVPRGTIVVERFLRGSPLLAPLLFANVGLLGLLVLLDPREKFD
ncbi:MAG: hypothetical protein D6712_07395 [Chloroflexi bacterium]|nr:MAG: hypothetical protein D6712_07395 [Chloroflexota bacterium]